MYMANQRCAVVDAGPDPRARDPEVAATERAGRDPRLHLGGRCNYIVISGSEFETVLEERSVIEREIDAGSNAGPGDDDGRGGVDRRGLAGEAEEDLALLD